MAGSITRYLHDLRKARTEAAREDIRRQLWRRGYDLLVRVAKRLVAHEEAEEVASDAFARFFQMAEGWSFRQMDNSEHFWKLLKVCVRNGALTVVRAARAPLRGGDWTRLPDQVLTQRSAATAPPGEEIDVEDPEEVWQFLTFLVEQLGEESLLCSIAFEHYFKGLDRDAICRKLDLSQATYYRKLGRIQRAVELFEARLGQAQVAGTCQAAVPQQEGDHDTRDPTSPS